MENEIIFPQYLPFKDRTYAIQGYIGQVEEYKDNKGYVKPETNDIYICAKDNEPVHLDVPIMMVSQDGSIDFIEPLMGRDPEFTVDNMYDLSYKNITETTPEDAVLYNEEAIQDMNAATTVFTPIINEDDDALKKIIKQTIIDKHIDLNRLKHKMPQKYGLTNMKQALVNKTKMSITNFNIWCELLGVTYEIIITDNGSDTIDPLNKCIHYTSNDCRLTETKR